MVLSNEAYLVKNNSIENKIKELLEEKERLTKYDFLPKTQEVLELSKSLYKAYFRVNKEWKTYIIKNLMLELFVDSKKELQIAETPLFKSLQILNFSYGIPNRNRTYANQGPRPCALPLSYGDKKILFLSFSSIITLLIFKRKNIWKFYF